MLERFELECRAGAARAGSFKTSHGEFKTPTFMPVGTRGSVKGVDAERLRESGAQIMLVNTYHLWLRPGTKLVQQLGGIHRFTAWSGPILSDSGGFQVFSLKGIRKLNEQGVEFRSHIDGAKCFLSPEVSVRVQEDLGVDIAMVLDECPAGDLPRTDVERSLELTLRWAKRSLEARQRHDMALFGITQGGTFPDLRKRAAEELSQSPFDAFAIGGLSVGESKDKMYDVLSYHPSQLPDHKLRYLMGVGTPRDLVEAVYRGVDIFDCVIPTRAGRFGRAYVTGAEPYLNIKNSRFQGDTSPLQDDCACLACRNYARGYIHHLFNVREMLGPQLLSIHNLSFYLSFMDRIRGAIFDGTFENLYQMECRRWDSAEKQENFLR